MSLESEVNRFDLPWTYSEDLRSKMAKRIFRSPLRAIREMAANGYDADAVKVEVHYDPTGDGQIIISDNGCGMRKGVGLEQFMEIGESGSEDLKRDNRKTPKGRTPIGTFGWGKLAGEYLAQERRIDTFRDGVHTWAIERIEKGIGQRVVSFQTQSCEVEKHGTTITLKGLNFKEGERNLTKEGVMRELREGMPVLELNDFEMYVNNDLVTPFVLRNAVEYVIDVEDPLIGIVKGSIFYASKPLGEEAALNIKVNGGGVGEKNLEVISTVASSLLGRIYGVINASGIDEIVEFGRAGLQDGPQKKRLYEIIWKTLRQVRQDMESQITYEKKQSLVGSFEKHRTELGKLVGEFFEEKRAYKLEMNAKKAGDLAVVDRTAGKVYVNPTSPAYLLKSLNPASVKEVLDLIVRDAISVSLLTGEDERDRFEDFRARMAQLRGQGLRSSKEKKWSLLDVLPHDEEVVRAEDFDPTLRVSEDRLFEYKETVRRTGYDRAMLDRFVESCVLPKVKDKFLGKDILELRQNMKDVLPLYVAVRRIPVPAGRVDYAYRQSKEQSANTRLSVLAQSGELPGYVRNISRRDDIVLFVVDKAKFGPFAYFLENWEFPQATNTFAGGSEDDLKGSEAIKLQLGVDSALWPRYRNELDTLGILERDRNGALFIRVSSVEEARRQLSLLKKPRQAIFSFGEEVEGYDPTIHMPLDEIILNVAARYEGESSTPLQLIKDIFIKDESTIQVRHGDEEIVYIRRGDVAQLMGKFKRRADYNITAEIIGGANNFYSMRGISRTEAKQRGDLVIVDEVMSRENPPLVKGESRFYEARYAMASLFRESLFLVDGYMPGLEKTRDAEFRTRLKTFL